LDEAQHSHSIRKDAFIDRRNVDGIVYGPRANRGPRCANRSHPLVNPTKIRLQQGCAGGRPMCRGSRRSLRTLSRWRLRPAIHGWALRGVGCRLLSLNCLRDVTVHASDSNRARPISFADVSGRPMTLSRRRAVLWPWRTRRYHRAGRGNPSSRNGTSGLVPADHQHDHPVNCSSKTIRRPAIPA
jgi:hypothetical protein